MKNRRKGEGRIRKRQGKAGRERGSRKGRDKRKRREVEHSVFSL